MRDLLQVGQLAHFSASGAGPCGRAHRSLMEVGKEHMHFRPPDEQNDHKARPWRLPSCRAVCEAVGKGSWEQIMCSCRLTGLVSSQVTCGVHASSVARVTKSIQAALDAADVAARLITSGHGDWRYLDIVSTGAGKLEALECVS